MTQPERILTPEQYDDLRYGAGPGPGGAPAPEPEPDPQLAAILAKLVELTAIVKDIRTAVR